MLWEICSIQFDRTSTLFEIIIILNRAVMKITRQPDSEREDIIDRDDLHSAIRERTLKYSSLLES